MKLVTLKATNFELTPDINQYIETKFGELEKLMKGIGLPHDLYIEIGKTTRHHRTGPIFRAEADLRLPAKVLRAEVEEIGLYGAIDILRDELRRQILSYKGSSLAKERRGRRLGKKKLNYDPAALEPGEADESKRHREEG